MVPLNFGNLPYVFTEARPGGFNLFGAPSVVLEVSKNRTPLGYVGVRGG